MKERALNRCSGLLKRRAAISPSLEIAAIALNSEAIAILTLTTGRVPRAQYPYCRA